MVYGIRYQNYLRYEILFSWETTMQLFFVVMKPSQNNNIHRCKKSLM